MLIIDIPCTVLLTDNTPGFLLVHISQHWEVRLKTGQEFYMIGSPAANGAACKAANNVDIEYKVSSVWEEMHCRKPNRFSFVEADRVFNRKIYSWDHWSWRGF